MRDFGVGREVALASLGTVGNHVEELLYHAAACGAVSLDTPRHNHGIAFFLYVAAGTALHDCVDKQCHEKDIA